MGLFSKSPTVKESNINVISTFASGIIKINDDQRHRMAPFVNRILTDYLSSLDLTENERKEVITMFQILAGTVGIEPSDSIRFIDSDISQFIAEALPFEMPMIIMGPIRMTIEEFVTGKEMKDIDYESFDLTDSRALINNLMDSIKVINERCLKNPKKHTKNEVYAIAKIAEISANHIKSKML
jgi:hypothetical protein